MTAHISCPACHFSPYALDPDTPESDYEVHLIKTHDPAYIPPDNEAWPLYYQVIVDALEPYPEAHQAIRRAVTAFIQKIKGRRALVPLPPSSPRQPNQPNPLPRLPDLGSRT